VRGNILGIFFSILSGVLIFLIAFAYSRSDRIAPEFRFSASDVTYNSKTADIDLKQGINAYDAKDGDLTGRIVVEKVVLNREKETAVVYYAVADFSGNVTKQSRVFPADIADIDNNGDSSETMEDEIPGQMNMPEFPFDEQGADVQNPEGQGQETTGEVSAVIESSDN
jgi:hypothetical protein